MWTIWFIIGSVKVYKKKLTTRKVCEMKFGKMLMVLTAVSTIVSSGCKSIPSVEIMKTTAASIGYAAGLVANETKINDKARNTIVEIVTEVSKVVPAQGQSFEDAWTPGAKELIAKLISDGKIDEGVGPVALAAFGVAVKGIDYIFDIRYPKAREYEELVAAAVSGFTEGFLSTFNPTNEEARVSAIKVDEEAYKWLKAKAKK